MFSRIDRLDMDMMARNTFMAYLRKSLCRNKAKYLLKSQNRCIEVLLDPHSHEWHCYQNRFFDEWHVTEDFDCSCESWDDVINSIENEQLYGILRRLNGFERKILFLRAIHHFSYHEIAEFCGISADKAARDYSNTIRKLRRWFKMENLP